MAMTDFEHVSFRNWVLLGDYYYASNMVTNDVIIIDKESLEIVDIIELHLERNVPEWRNMYFVNIAGHAGKLYLFPYFYAEYMVTVDIQTRGVEYRKMSEACGYEGFIVPRKYLQLDNRLYFLPDAIGDSVYYFNMETESFERDKALTEALMEKCTVGNKLLYGDVYVRGAELWSAVGKPEAFFCMNCQTKEVSTFVLEGRQKEWDGICADDKRVWYMNGDGEVCVLDRLSNAITGFQIGSSPIKYWELVSHEDRVILLSNDNKLPNVIKTLTINDGLVENVGTDMLNMSILPDERARMGLLNYIDHESFGDALVFFPQGLDGMLVLEPTTLDVRKIELTLDKERFEAYLDDIMKNCIVVSGVLREEKKIGLIELLEGKLDKYFGDWR